MRCEAIARDRRWLIIAALALLGCLVIGALLGDVFETQHNAASL